MPFRGPCGGHDRLRAFPGDAVPPRVLSMLVTAAATVGGLSVMPGCGCAPGQPPPPGEALAHEGSGVETAPSGGADPPDMAFLRDGVRGAAVPLDR